VNLIPNLIRWRGVLTPVGSYNALRILLDKSRGYPRPGRRGPLAKDSWFYRPLRRPDPCDHPLFANDILQSR
jgi:hypothetical protein